MVVDCATEGMSPRSAGGMSTLSITWMTPFDAGTSASTTLASLTMTPSATVNERSSSLTAVAVMPSVTADAGTEPETTWYSRISVSVALPSTVSNAARSIPAAANASSVGANTVNGPVPWSVSTSSAWARAATSAVWMVVAWAVIAMFIAGVQTYASQTSWLTVASCA